ncbi:U1 small nuclear ribonucleoprotein 70 kDa isoform X2 [Galendromus occidentalis]|uniref:U1 small nuclear ribonucleoprotein 70 kDa n=1 Tax=Galendromus occidentalis TaxID=34638 RepID=A0AAJ6QZ42_9ACAR|nr:U1 small nuclear ribonucleoprotein 70 kDa isoform X2 [Galendromus occidentalis]
MTQFLPPNLLALFKARDPIPFLHPIGKLPHEKQQETYIGVGTFIRYFEDPSETPPAMRVETREERRERRKKEKAEETAYQLEQAIALWDPNNNPKATADPFKTLFIARINYETSEGKLRREFEQYGAIKQVSLIHSSISNKPRGYAFIEYAHERDMHAAYKHADGKKIDSRRVLVDVERGRTVKGWLPRRLGGGLGGTRRGGPDVNVRHSGREDNNREERAERGERGERANGDRDRERDRDRDRRRSRSRDRRDRRGGGERPDRVDRDDRRRDRRDRRERSRDREDRDRKRRKSRSRSRDDRRKAKRFEDDGRFARGPVDDRGERLDDDNRMPFPGMGDNRGMGDGRGMGEDPDYRSSYVGDNGEVFHIKQEHEIKHEVDY